MADDTSGPMQTSLHDIHVEAGARMVDFAGWSMPVQYSGVIDEHRAVRQAAGLFDVSHMGEFRVSGPESEAFLQSMTPNDVTRLAPGRAHYSGLLTESGTYVDDLLIYRLGDEEFLLVVNAANRAKDFAWLESHSIEGIELEDVSSSYALLALQGPAAREILRGLASCDLNAIRYYAFEEAEVAGENAIVSRTGYTGEDGFELYLEPSAAPEIWRRLISAGSSLGLVPAGLGARDTLRLEAGMALYGHEIDEATTPLEAGLDWVVKLDQGEFLGRDALLAQRQSGPKKKLIGLEVQGRGIARQGHAVVVDGVEVGRVTSGTWSPTFEKAIGMAHVPAELAEVDRDLTLDVRGRSVPARVVALPFYKRERPS